MSNENKPSPILHLVDPAGNVVTVKRHSLKKGPDGAPVLKPGWKLHAPKAAPAPAPTPAKK